MDFCDVFLSRYLQMYQPFLGKKGKPAERLMFLSFFGGGGMESPMRCEQVTGRSSLFLPPR